MAHLPLPIQSKKGMKYIDQTIENYVNSSHTSSNFRFKEKPPTFSAAVQKQTITNVLIPLPLNDAILNKQYRSEQNSISIQSNNFSTDRKSQVYVHHFNKVPDKSSSNSEQNNWRGGNEIHQNMYKHEFSGFYDAKIKAVRRQFDNLSLRKSRAYTSNKMPSSSYHSHHNDYYNQQAKIPFICSNASSKLNRAMLFRPDNKAEMDKLEETYWAKWKPKKALPTRQVHHKAKGLYTENEKLRQPSEIAQVHRCVRKERGDSNETIVVSHTASRKSQIVTDRGLTFTENKEVEEGEEEELVQDKPTGENEDKSDHRDEPGNSGEKIIEASHESDSECSVNGLKHTDSFILTSIKQSQDKPHYQQPKCIKLFKNAGYSPNTSVNYIKAIKGGSYPLRSCLKREGGFPKLNYLGRPGSPIKGTTTRRPGKANRFTK